MFGRANSSGGETILPAEPRRTRTGKGRPTPKRREVERGRRRVAAAPLDRKEAYRRNRDLRREQRRRQMEALRAGDERHLPLRDRGPVRGYVRDTVDARRSVGELFLPAALVILVLTSIGNVQLQVLGTMLWMFLTVLLVVDIVALVIRLRRGLARNYPHENTRGAVTYGVMRSMQIRRFRLPPARVGPGRRRRADAGRGRVRRGGS